MNYRQATKWKAKDEKDFRLLKRSIDAMKLQGEPQRSVQIRKWLKMLRRAAKIKLNRGQR